MDTNALPVFDDSVNTTGCCPRFNDAGWDDQVLHFEGKPFVRAETHGEGYVPRDMGEVMGRVQGAIAAAGAQDPHQVLVLSRDLSPERAEHLFAVTRPVPGEAMTTLSGDFVTQTFEGPFEDMPEWHRRMAEAVAARGRTPGDVWFFYTTCPACAEAYGRNPVVGVARL